MPNLKIKDYTLFFLLHQRKTKIHKPSLYDFSSLKSTAMLL